MKLKLDTKSIKFKTWLYFILFAAFLMITLWVVQVLLLNHFYGTMKTTQTRSVASEITSAFKHDNSNDFFMKVNDISDSYDMYIYVVSYDGKTTYYSPSAENYARTPGFAAEIGDGGNSSEYGTSNYPIGIYASQFQKLNEQMLKNNGSAYMKFEGSNKSQQILACANILQSKQKEDMIVYIFSPLWPISSTVKILANQLLIVTIVSLIMACIISFYLSLRISRPIRKINYSAKCLANGEYGIIFKGGHYTELKELADTLTGASIELEKSNLLQKDLIANVSHDLKTPLTMIKSYAEMIRDISIKDTKKCTSHLQVIIDEADRLNGLVEDLLAISRAQSGKMLLEKSVFKLNDAVENIINTYKVMEEDGYHFNYQYSSDFAVEADEEKIKQVVSNLISNAVKYCGSDTTIGISLVKHGRFVRCSIEDHGEGIPSKDLNHIWERYYRSSTNMHRSAEGTGLGLSICKEILTLHKSDFGVISTPGKGTTFWFELKIVPSPH